MTVHVAFDAFVIGILVGLLLARMKGRPLLRFPLHCWFLGHRPQRNWATPDDYYQCRRCRLYLGLAREPVNRWVQTFWTT